ncbi:hypothetical protein BH24ACI1_BH24ACI1_17060 [soil metagenome]
MQRKMFLLLIASVSLMIFSATALAQQKFVGHLNGIQEVPPVNSTGNGVCTVTLNSTETQITVNATFRGLLSPANAGHIHNMGPVGVNGPVRFPFTGVSGTSGTLGPFTFPVTAADVADLRAKRLYCNIYSTNFPGGEIRGQVKIVSTPFDFDGDGRTDLRVRRNGATGFYTLFSVNNSVATNFFGGANPLNSASDDYDGDGRGDFLLYTFPGDILWRILQTATNTSRDVLWGNTTVLGDQLLPADYDCDGKTDVAVFRRSTGVWYIIQSSNNQQQVELFGALNDLGMVGDFDKDGKSDLTIIRGTPNGIGWFTRRSSDNKMQTVLWGGGTTMPAGDFIFPANQVDVDGDGRQDHLVRRDPNAAQVQGDPVTYYILRSSDNQALIFQWGLDTDAALFGDYDGDGKTDFVARRNIGGELVWFILQSSNNYNTSQQRTMRFGVTGDLSPEEPEDEGILVNNF